MVLRPGVLNVGEPFTALPDEVGPPARQIAGGPHGGRIHVRLRQHPSAQQHGDLVGIKHGVPHFHAVYGEYEISVEVETGTIHGHFPPRALKLVRHNIQMEPTAAGAIMSRRG
ncbi:MAG: DUF4160 domain-containing protein [Gemmatimonadetes bacterium]|nr:DUF4160 domain-containing protein [Gemmatimonadota bacterium]